MTERNDSHVTYDNATGMYELRGVQYRVVSERRKRDWEPYEPYWLLRILRAQDDVEVADVHVFPIGDGPEDTVYRALGDGAIMSHEDQKSIYLRWKAQQQNKPQDE